MLKAFRLPVFWLGLVLFLGGSGFGIQQTAPWVVPILKTLVPWSSGHDVHALHVLLRKLGHLTEYAILARVWLHGLFVWRRMSVRAAAWGALLICVAVAFVDEAHQSMLLSRTGSVADAILDCLGALLMLMLLRARYEAATTPVTAT